VDIAADKVIEELPEDKARDFVADLDRGILFVLDGDQLHLSSVGIIITVTL
jgi:hypothetical protein